VNQLGDFTPGKTIVARFNSHTAAGLPITLAGGTISVYKNSTTESTAGVTLTVDYDGRTGLHSVVVDTSADPTFYAAGADFDIVIAAGTVNSISVAGTVVGTFSIANRSTGAPAGLSLAADVAAVKSDSTAIKLKTDNLPSDPADQSLIIAATDAITSAIAALENLSAAQVNAEVDAALADYDGPTNAEMVARTLTSAAYATAATQTTHTTHLTDIKGATFSGATDSLEAIRDRGDAAWVTGSGTSTLTAAEVRTELAVELARIDVATSTRLATAGYTAPDNSSIAAILDDTGTSGVKVADDSKDGYSLASSGVDAIVIEAGLNLRQAISIIVAGEGGELSGADTTTIVIHGAGVATTRMTATVDVSGNRTSVALSPPA
jgi:hypothetical protein